LGIDALNAASSVLQHFHHFPEAQTPVADQLAELRALARSVADLISKAPSVHDSYFVGDQVVTHDELSHTMDESPNIFRCQVNWGCFWQETPEETIALYRHLMSSPVFCYLHQDLWVRPTERPRLVAWNDKDRRSIPAVWDKFVRELQNSPDINLQLEAKAFALADARNEQQKAVAFTNFFNSLMANSDALVSNHVEVLYSDWRAGALVPGGGVVTPLTETMQRLYRSEYRPKLEAMDEEYWRTTVHHFPKQKAPQPSAPTQASRPPLVAKVPSAAKAPASTAAQEVITNVLTVDQFLAIPLDGLHSNQITGVTLRAHHWVEDKLLLDFSYNALIYKFDTNGNWLQARPARYPAIAILDPKTQRWDVAPGPEEHFAGGNYFYHRSTLWRGELFHCDGTRIKKYDFKTREWKALEISDGNRYELFAIAGHLYAANESTVFEITEDGKHTRLLASARRQPPMSALDAEDLGTPALFEGPGHALRLATPHGIFTWTGADWRKDLDMPGGAIQPAIFPDCILFVAGNFGLYRLATESDAAELCVRQRAGAPNIVNNFRPGAETPQGPEPKWKLPPKLLLGTLPRASRQSDLFLLADHCETKEIIDEKKHLILGDKVVMKGGCHAELLCFSSGLPSPQTLYLKFDAAGGRPPVAATQFTFSGLPMTPPAWMLFADDYLFFGVESAQEILLNQTVPLNTNDHDKTGVWLMPLSKLDPAIARQKQAQLEQERQTAASAEQTRQSLLAKYDRNHNGVIDPNEKEDALDDPDFIASELDVIDANHNGWLDAEELSYFDANKNKILEPKEEAGIGIAQHLLAARLLKEFDANGDGLLDSKEFKRMVEDHYGLRPPPGDGGWFSSADSNHDGFIDLEELESFLKQRTTEAVHLRRISAPGHFHQPPLSPAQMSHIQSSFKAAVEAYWQIPAGATNQPGLRSKAPSNAGSAPNLTPRNVMP
jgi:Ca2+-binding EF-hand superfamily protein